MEKSVARGTTIGVILGLAVNGLILAVHAYAVSGYGSWGVPGIEFLFLPVVVAFLAIPVAVVFAAFERSRRFGEALLALGVTYALIGVLSHLGASRLRIWGFAKAAQRAQPLVTGLHRYYDAHGSAPGSLNELVPNYTMALPERIPPLELVSGAQAREHFDGNPWVLQADVPTGLINWDLFLYYPLQNYPEVGHGGRLERVGDWAYVWE